MRRSRETAINMFDHEDEAPPKTSVNEGHPLETRRWSSNQHDVIFGGQEVGPFAASQKAMVNQMYKALFESYIYIILYLYNHFF